MGMFEKWKWGGVKTADALRCFLLHHFGGVYGVALPLRTYTRVFNGACCLDTV